MNNTYNGWSNRETWLINVWFNPESAADVWNAKDQLESDLDALPVYLKDFINDGIIDWEELAAHFEESDNEESEVL